MPGRGIMYLTSEADKRVPPLPLRKVAELLRRIADDLDAGTIYSESLPMLLSPKNTNDTFDVAVLLVPPSRIKASEHARQLLSTLTPRQKDVLDLLISGMQAKMIALSLGVSQRTVEKHISSIFRKTMTHKIHGLFKVAYSCMY
jgi:DNA-binding NarL/FixJ family response regulator